jgi:hypothetical protein
MRVEIISGNEAGVVKDLPQIEAEVAISTGYAKPVYEGPASIEELKEEVKAAGYSDEAAQKIAEDRAAGVYGEGAKVVGLPSAADLDAAAQEAELKERAIAAVAPEQSDAVLSVETGTPDEAAKLAAVPEGATAEQQPNIEGSAAGN